jgi:hypothetical protein
VLSRLFRVDQTIVVVSSVSKTWREPEFLPGQVAVEVPVHPLEPTGPIGVRG